MSHFEFYFDDESGNHEIREVRNEYKEIDPKTNKRKKKTYQQAFVNGKWVNELKGITQNIYRYAETRQHIERGDLIIWVEGAKKADILQEALRKANIGCGVTSLAGGASSRFKPRTIAAVSGIKEMAFLADSNAVGRTAARENAEILARENPDANIKVTDFFPEAQDEHHPYWARDVVDYLREQTINDVLAKINEAEPLSFLTPSIDDPSASMWGEEYEWPSLHKNAYYGLAGEFITIVDPHTESDPAALLLQFLTLFGSMSGASARFLVEATPHSPRINALIVGDTARARKGTGGDQVKRIFRIADEECLDAILMSGLASGEGLIFRLRDRDGEMVEKRVQVFESEFSRLITKAAKEGAIVSMVIRDAYDTGNLQNVTKDPIIAKNTHVSIIGHITAEELREKISSTEIANGFLNRFLLVCAKRSKRLPHGGDLSDGDLGELGGRLREALDFARSAKTMHRDDAANRLWETWYCDLPELDGLLGAVTARPEAMVLRLSIIYALLDKSTIIRESHLRAALAVWDYCFASAQFIFGRSLGNPIADRLLSALRDVYPTGLTGREIDALFGKSLAAGKLDTARDSLLLRALIRRERTPSGELGGRPQETWFAVPSDKPGKPDKPPALDTQGIVNPVIPVNPAPRETESASLEIPGEPVSLLPLPVPSLASSDQADQKSLDSDEIDTLRFHNDTLLEEPGDGLSDGVRSILHNSQQRLDLVNRCEDCGGFPTLRYLQMQICPGCIDKRGAA